MSKYDPSLEPHKLPRVVACASLRKFRSSVAPQICNQECKRNIQKEN